MFVQEKNESYSQKYIKIVPRSESMREKTSANPERIPAEKTVWCVNQAIPPEAEVRSYPRDNSQGFYRLYRKNCNLEKPYWENQSEFGKKQTRSFS